MLPEYRPPPIGFSNKIHAQQDFLAGPLGEIGACPDVQDRSTATFFSVLHPPQRLSWQSLLAHSSGNRPDTITVVSDKGDSAQVASYGRRRGAITGQVADPRARS